MTEDFVLAAAKDIIEPIGRKSAYTTSRLAILKDGTTKPVLLILAEAKFKDWSEDQFPFWVDGDYTNETSKNVGLATRSAKASNGPRNPFGVPAGTKEYMRLWRSKNKDKVRASQRRYLDKVAGQVSAAKEAIAEFERSPEPEASDDVISRLEEIITSSRKAVR